MIEMEVMEMSLSVCIQEVHDIRASESRNWHRKQASPRGFDALVLITAGEISYCFAHKTVTVKAGDLLLLPGNLPYSGIRHSDLVGFFVIDFQCVSPDELQRIGAPCVLKSAPPGERLAEFSSLLSMWQRQPIERDLAAKAFLYTTLAQAFSVRESAKSVTASEEIVDYILNHLSDETLSVENLCRHFFISESQLRRNIVKVTGLRPNEYILKLRLNRAKAELLDTDKATKQIAATCGFSSPYYFSRCFAKEFGLPPREFRKRFQS